nr:uncharacterized protein CI109_007041 [Kwoniella shandongensis]KAA5524606.1 hypothetical protein CI109_007041 [Kwoniella shandongensis]
MSSKPDRSTSFSTVPSRGGRSASTATGSSTRLSSTYESIEHLEADLSAGLGSNWPGRLKFRGPSGSEPTTEELVELGSLRRQLAIKAIESENKSKNHSKTKPKGTTGPLVARQRKGKSDKRDPQECIDWSKESQELDTIAKQSFNMLHSVNSLIPKRYGGQISMEWRHPNYVMLDRFAAETELTEYSDVDKFAAEYIERSKAAAEKRAAMASAAYFPALTTPLSLDNLSEAVCLVFPDKDVQSVKSSLPIPEKLWSLRKEVCNVAMSAENIHEQHADTEPEDVYPGLVGRQRTGWTDPDRDRDPPHAVKWSADNKETDTKAKNAVNTFCALDSLMPEEYGGSRDFKQWPFHDYDKMDRAVTEEAPTKF